MKLTDHCKYCNKISRIQSQELSAILSKYLLRLECGHCYFVDKIKTDSEDYNSTSGSLACYPYQIDGIKFVEQTNYNALIADAMGLGKTIQALVAIRNAKEKLTPCLIIVRTNTIPQWLRETWKWFDYQPTAIYPVIGSKTFVVPGFPLYLVSMDTLARNGMWQKFVPLNLQSVIVDECHSFKDTDAKRTIALVKLLQQTGIKHKLLLSGTPIKNRANEFFTALNLLAPQIFSSKKRFEWNWLEPNEKGIYSRISRYRINEFRELISKWVIRREKEEVLKDLPELRQDYKWVSVDNQLLIDQYNAQVDELEALGPNANIILTLGILTRLRKILAEMKIPMVADDVEDFLNSCEDEKIAVGVHHHVVRDGLKMALKSRGIESLTYSGEDSPWKKDAILDKFEHDLYSRVLIISEQAGGFGLNLQFCPNVIIMERQWNYADEEQFISRFHRNGQTKAVNATRVLADGNTVDKYLDDIYWDKKNIFQETVCNWSFTQDESAIRQLVERVTARRL